MGQLREKMKDDLTLRNYRPKTVKEYLRCACKFVAHHRRPPGEMGEPEARQFLLHLTNVQHVSAAHVKMHVAAIKFLYGVTLDRPEVAVRLAWPRVPIKLPIILDQSEVEGLLEAIESVKYRALLMTAYSAGLRLSEAFRLATTDIDSRRGLIHIRDGKGAGDRYVMLSPRVLVVLRAYWRALRPAGSLLFPGQVPGQPVSPDAVRAALHAAAVKAGIRKHITPHVLRHRFATHLHNWESLASFIHGPASSNSIPIFVAS